MLVLALCACAAIRVASPVRLALALTTTIPVLILATGLARAYRRYRRDGLGQVAALHADAVPLPARKLMVHEAASSPARCAGHGARTSDIAVPYASGGAAVLFAFAYAETLGVRGARILATETASDRSRPYQAIPA